MSFTESRQEGRLPDRRHSVRPRREGACSEPPAARGTGFFAGQEAGARTSACVARLAALELMEGARWWNRWRRRLMAGALVACAEEMECAADASGTRRALGVPRPAPAHDPVGRLVALTGGAGAQVT